MNICITTDCISDVPVDLLEKYNIKVFYFNVVTERGRFKDMDEITAPNVVEFFENGGKHIHSSAPEISEYVEGFKEKLEKYDGVIHVAAASYVSDSFKNANIASEQLDGKVWVYDTGHLSSGIAHFVITAAQMLEKNCTVEEIFAEFDLMRSRVNTSFFAKNADYLYRAGKVSKQVKDFCSIFSIHPVLYMSEGLMKVKRFYIGNYEKAIYRYINKELRSIAKMKKQKVFLTHSVCPVRITSKIRATLEECNYFDEIYDVDTCATITCNCGADAVGLLYETE